MTTSTVTDTTPRVWPAYLNCYNNGRLVGQWVDCTGAADVAIEALHEGTDGLYEGCGDLVPWTHENLPVRGEMTLSEVARWAECYCPFARVVNLADHLGARTVVPAWRPTEQDEHESCSGRLGCPMAHGGSRQPVNAHLDIALTALAIARWVETRIGVSIRRFADTLRPYHTVTIKGGARAALDAH